MNIEDLFIRQMPSMDGVFILHGDGSDDENQSQTNEAFSNKWEAYSNEDLTEQEKLFEFQKRWYLKLYGFVSEQELAEYLKEKPVIVALLRLNE